MLSMNPSLITSGALSWHNAIPLSLVMGIFELLDCCFMRLEQFCFPLSVIKIVLCWRVSQSQGRHVGFLHNGHESQLHSGIVRTSDHWRRDYTQHTSCHHSLSQTPAVVLCLSVSLVNSPLVTSFSRFWCSDLSSCSCGLHEKGTGKWCVLTNCQARTEGPSQCQSLLHYYSTARPQVLSAGLFAHKMDPDTH